jgi:hypothetical protein
MRQLQPEHELIAVEGTASSPGQALFGEGFADARSVEYLKAAAGDADRAAGPVDLGPRFQHDDRMAALREFKGRERAHGSSTDNDDEWVRQA